MSAYKSSSAYSAYKVVREKKAAYLVQRKRLRALLRKLSSDAGLTQVQLAARLQRDQPFVVNTRAASAGSTF